MRLLNTDTRQLREFTNDIPRYAILSHTWKTPEEEVLFDDMRRGTASNKPEYPKIVRACEQAKDDEHDWIWIDTCCIDKSSSAELSEAINSMYRWYRNAATCYACLENVPATADTDSSEFAASRWFKRGWTLQEMIAPSSLIFYSEDWTKIGTKSESYEKLSSITGVDVGILTGSKALESTSIAKRMSWASNRETSRDEDGAYSLMGLFGVSMPMLYGEGQEASFLRLQEEIMKYSDDQSIFAWKNMGADADSHHGLLASHPRDFVKSGSIIPYRDWEARTPFSMTNRGLHIDLHLSRYQNNIYVAALDCPAPDHFDGFLGIFLKRLSSGDRQYARVKPHEFCKIPLRGGIETVYVRQRIVLSTSQDVYPTHVFQLRKGPAPEDDYRLVDAIANTKPNSLLRPVEPARARSWVPRGLPYIFQAAKGSTQLSGALVFKRIDGEQLIVMIGSTADFGVGFDVAIRPRDEDVPEQSGFYFDPKEVGQYMIVEDHRVRVDIESQVHADVKYLMVDVLVEAIEESSTGLVTRVFPRLQRLAEEPQPNGLPKARDAPSRLKSFFKPKWQDRPIA